MKLIAAGSTYNVKTATCVFRCVSCNGVSSYVIIPSPITLPIPVTETVEAQATWNTGTISTGASSWSSANTSIATVSGSGSVSSVAPGSTTITASETWPNPAQVCSYNVPECGYLTREPQAPTSVVSIIVYNSGTQISQNQTVYISATPQMPNIQTQLSGAASGQPVTWTFNAAYTGGDGISYNGTLSGSTTGTGLWTLPFSTFVGGSSTVTAQYQGTTLSFPFVIQGINPSAGAIDSVLTSQSGPWFWLYMVSWESSYQQFVGGNPNFGAPHGFGLSMPDPPPSVADLWNWQQNLADGFAQLNSKQASAYTFESNQIEQWAAWNSQNPTQQVGGPPNDPEGGPCTFTYPVQNGTRDFSDADWMKAYNGAAQYYLIWQNQGSYAAAPVWQIVAGPNNYVHNVCNSPLR